MRIRTRIGLLVAPPTVLLVLAATGVAAAAPRTPSEDDICAVVADVKFNNGTKVAVGRVTCNAAVTAGMDVVLQESGSDRQLAKTGPETRDIAPEEDFRLTASSTAGEYRYCAIATVGYVEQDQPQSNIRYLRATECEVGPTEPATTEPATTEPATTEPAAPSEGGGGG